MNGKMQLGFTMRIQLRWLERTSGLLLAGHTRNQIRKALTELLRDQISVNGAEGRTSRDKTVTILLKTWVAVPRHLEGFRDDALAHLRCLGTDDHLPLHWGMAMAVYPFFGVVTEVVGRLLRLQGTAAAAQIQRRVRELLGERETVSRATRRILRSLIEWGVLTDAEDKGVYEPTPRHRIKDTRVGAWLVEATLLAKGSFSAALEVVLQSPALFPFELPQLRPKEFESMDRPEMFREGGDVETLAFRQNVRDSGMSS